MNMEKYETPIMTIIELEGTSDIIRTSLTEGTDTGVGTDFEDFLSDRKND